MVDYIPSQGEMVGLPPSISPILRDVDYGLFLLTPSVRVKKETTSLFVGDLLADSTVIGSTASA